MYDEIVEEIEHSTEASLDFETIGKFSLVPYKATVEGAAVGWKIDGEYRSEYWSFPHGGKVEYNLVEWKWFQKNILEKIWNSTEKTLIFHNGKFDIQIALRYLFGPNLKSGEIFDKLPKSKVEDTMYLSFMADENIPKSLKELSRIKLKKPRMTYEATQKSLKEIEKEADTTINSYFDMGWNLYKENRQKSMTDEEDILEGTPEFTKRVLLMPPKLKKAEFADRFRDLIAPDILRFFCKKYNDTFAQYAKEDASDTIILYDLFKKELSDWDFSWVHNVEWPFNMAVLEAEVCGVYTDTDLLSKLKEEVCWLLEKRIENIKKVAISEYGMPENFNPGSHDQVKNLIWNKMGMAAPSWVKATKKGLPPTNAEVMKYLAEQNSFCDEFRKVSALKTFRGNFVNPLFESSMAMAGWARTAYNTIGAFRTGRVSSSPNFQNVTNERKMPTAPALWIQSRHGDVNGSVSCWNKIDEETYRMVALRKIFKSPPGHVYIVSDLSQIELRYMAHVSQDENMLMAYQKYDCECGATGRTTQPLHNCPECGAAEGERDVLVGEQPVKNGFCLGLDLHSLTAFKMGLFEHLDPKEARNKLGKPFNFGLSYGMSAYKLCHDLGYDPDDKEKLDLATSYRTGFFRTYQGIYFFHKRVEEQIKRRGGGVVNMVLGRKRRFTAQNAQIVSGNMIHSKEQATVREAINNIIQGSAADHLKIGTSLFFRRKQENPRLRHVYIPLNIHDEIVVCVREEHAEECLHLVRYCLENAISLSVPVLSSAKIVKDWSEGK